jgi:hypothetical protein
VGGASASAVPIADTPQTPNTAPGHEIILGEEEMADVSRKPVAAAAAAEAAVAAEAAGVAEAIG